MVGNLIVELGNWLPGIAQGSDFVTALMAKLPFSWMTIAQQVNDPNVLGQMQNAWNSFVKTGQIWAFAIGLILGYMARIFTSFG